MSTWKAGNSNGMNESIKVKILDVKSVTLKNIVGEKETVEWKSKRCLGR